MIDVQRMIDTSRAQRFGKEIGQHLVCWYVDNVKSTVFAEVTDEMKPPVNVFGPSVETGPCCGVNR